MNGELIDELVILKTERMEIIRYLPICQRSINMLTKRIREIEEQLEINKQQAQTDKAV